MAAASYIKYQGSHRTHELEFIPLAMCTAGRDLNCSIKKAAEVWNKVQSKQNSQKPAIQTENEEGLSMLPSIQAMGVIVEPGSHEPDQKQARSEKEDQHPLSGRINISYVERANLTIRQCVSMLTRRT